MTNGDDILGRGGRPGGLGLATLATFGAMAMGVLAPVMGCSSSGPPRSTTCLYDASRSLTTPAKFSFSVTLPDGSVQSCATLQSQDGGFGLPRPFSGAVSGSVTDVAGASFGLDACAAGSGCSPEVHRFAVDTPELSLPLPPGRQVTVTWMLSSIVGRACEQVLVISDGPPSDAASGAASALWLAGADATIEPSIALPFSVVEKALSCNPHPSATHSCGGAVPPDDYALVFAPGSGEPALSLATGATGTLALTPAPGLAQHLTVHNLRSYQTANCDDYWNWGWWAAGRLDSNGQLE